MQIRPIRDQSDLEQLVGVMNAVRPDDPATLDEFVAWGEQAPDRVDLVAERDGKIVGGSRVFLQTTLLDPWLHVWVPEGERRQGVGTALYGEASRWAASKGSETLRAWVREDAPGCLAFANGLGFREIGRERGVALDLSTIEAPVVEPPPGIELTTWAERPDLTDGLYEVFAEAVVDIPGEGPEGLESYDDWLRTEMQSTGDRPEATFVALAGDEAVGYAKFHFTTAQPTILHHDLTGVKRAWRSRGIASALKTMQIRWAKENGYEELHTRNEERNAPIRKLNERFDYRPTFGRINLRGTIAER